MSYSLFATPTLPTDSFLPFHSFLGFTCGTSVAVLSVVMLCLYMCCVSGVSGIIIVGNGLAWSILFSSSA